MLYFWYFAAVCYSIHIVNSQQVVVMAPNIFHMDVSESVVVTAYNTYGRDVNAIISLRDWPNKKHRFSSTTVKLRQNMPQTVTFKVRPEDIVKSSANTLNKKRYVSLNIDYPLINPFSRKIHSTHKELLILLHSGSGHVFLQTDKPIYNPSQTAMIRVLPVKHDMTLSTKPVTVDIINPQGIIVRRRELEMSNQGFLADQYQFAKNPLMGVWTIKARHGYNNELSTEVKFKVEEYVLPRYKVEVIVPDYLLPSTHEISVKISARYVFGKHVNAKVVVTFGILENGKLQKVGIVKEKLSLLYKYTAVRFKMEAFRRYNKLWYPDQGRLYVQVKTLELTTGKWTVEENTDCRFVRSPYVFKFNRTSKYFQPSISYDLKIDGRLVNGKPASRLKILVRSIGIMGPADGNKKIQLTTGNGKNGDELELNNDGQLTLRVDGHPKVQKLQIKVKSQDPRVGYNDQAEAILEVLPYTSLSRSYLKLRIAQHSPKVGDLVLAEVTLSKHNEVRSLTIMIMSRGRIVYNATKVGQFGISVTFHFTVTKEMTPSFRALAFYVRSDGEVVTDSTWVDVVDKCGHEFTVTTDKTTYKPDGNGHIVVKGMKGLRFGLLAVDQSVLWYRNEGLLTSHTIYKTMESDDLGCGVGGAANAQQVFRDSGLAVFGTTKLSTRTKSSKGCDTPKRSKRATRIKLTPQQIACCNHGRLYDGEFDCLEAAKLFPNSTIGCKKMYYQCCYLTQDRKPQRIESMGMNKNILASFGRSASDAQLGYIPSFEDIEEYSPESDNLRWRRNFKESWLFEDYEIGPSGEHRQSISFPSTVTEWVIQAVGLSSTARICVATPRNVTTFNEFFVDVRLPAVAVRMEQLEIVATVFNYFPYPLPVHLYMVGVKGLCSEARPGKRTPKKRFIIQPKQSRSMTFPIMPLDVGEFEVKLLAFSFSGHDAVIKKLRVLHEGKQVRKTKSAVLDPAGELSGKVRLRRDASLNVTVIEKSHGTQKHVVDLILPDDALPSTDTCNIFMTGDLMGPSVNVAITGVTNMLRLPTGCGEQTMIKLAPNVYSYKYLKSRGDLSKATSTKAVNYILRGYQHQLTYRKKDGSFSVWPHLKSSTWLTAFSLKVFCQARQLNISLDSSVVCSGLQYILSQQQSNGQFKETFWVYHKEMVGGINEDITMTAYMVITLLECRCTNMKQDNQIALSIKYLESQIKNLKRPLAAAMTTYALALGKSVKAKQANLKLMAFAKVDNDGSLSWSTASRYIGGRVPYWYTRKPSALAVETTAYALLAQLALNDTSRINEIVVWLVKQRNSKGAFVSTQDTVVALQALSEYSIQTRKAELDMKCKLSAKHKPYYNKLVQLKERDALVQKSVENVPTGGELNIKSEGTGVGEMQVELVYNVLKSDAETCFFEMNVTSKELNMEDNLFDTNVCNPCKGPCSTVETTTDDGGYILYNGDDAYDTFDVKKYLNGLDTANDLSKSQSRVARAVNGESASKAQICVRVCARNLQATETGMAIIEVGLFTGFEAIIADLKKLVRSDDTDANPEAVVDKFEVTDRSIQFYLSSIPRNESVCVGFRATRENNVQNIHPVAVNVYDYYEPNKACTEFYEPDSDSPLMKTFCRGTSCLCMEGRCPAVPPVSERNQYTTGYLFRFACRNADFVYKVKVKSTTEAKEKKIKYKMVEATLLQVGKAASTAVKINTNLNFWYMSSCKSFALLKDHEYMIMAKEGQFYQDNQSRKSYKLLLDDTAFILPFYDQQNNYLNPDESRIALMQRQLFTVLTKRGCPN